MGFLRSPALAQGGLKSLRLPLCYAFERKQCEYSTAAAARLLAICFHPFSFRRSTTSSCSSPSPLWRHRTLYLQPFVTRDVSVRGQLLLLYVACMETRRDSRLVKGSTDTCRLRTRQEVLPALLSTRSRHYRVFEV